MDTFVATRPGPAPSALVIGGGLAGISAACSLADRGFQVTLVERRPFLGGRAFSFFDRGLGQEVDNGQHVILKCCTAYLELMGRLGVSHKLVLQPRLRVDVFDGHKKSAIYRVALPAPLHLLPSLLRYRHLSWWDKLWVGYGVARMLLTDRRRHPELDSVTFHQWLTAHRQTERSIRNLWDLIILPTCNDTSRVVSADQAIMVFQEGFLRRSEAGDIGYAGVGLTSLLGTEAVEYLAARGGRVLLEHEVLQFEVDSNRVLGVRLAGGHILAADYYVSAVPFHRLPSLLPASAADSPFFSSLQGLKSSPIINVHLWYDRPIFDGEFAAFLNSPAQFLFNKSRMWRQNSQGQYLCVSISGAHQYVQMPKEALFSLVVGELERLLPNAKGARVLSYRVIKETRATFSAAPGAKFLRPGPQTPFENLLLAGEWTATDWPSTMEGAVRSGVAAARAVVAAYRRQEVEAIT